MNNDEIMRKVNPGMLTIGDEEQRQMIYNSINTIGLICGGDDNKIINLLIAYLWDAEEAGNIKRKARG